MVLGRRLRLVAAVIGSMALVTGGIPAQATHNGDQHRNMNVVSTSPNASINTDLAFWGDHAFIGYYRNDAAVGGVRIFDISNPANPQLVKNVVCDGLQNDPIVWDRNGNGIADLMLLAVDRTMESSECGAPRSAQHDDPDGWEGVRIFEMSDNPANPFATVEQVAAVYTDCGAHTITLWPGEADEGRLLVYVSSYPLRPGPTCGETRGPAAGRDPLHGVIQVLEVPLNNPSAAQEIAEPPINYPNDPDNQIDWTERGLVAPGVLETAARACHDISVHVKSGLAAGACAEQGQLWRIDENGIPDTANPVWVSDDEVTSGGSGDIPGAVDFFHSATFSNDASVVNWIDESFGDGCPPETEYQPREWNPAGGTHKTGRMFFVRGGSGSFVSEFQVGDVRPEPGAYCSAHMGLPITNTKKDLLVNAWYMGGVDVINFTKPARLKEIAYYDMAPDGPLGSDNWSAYSYVGPNFRRGPGVPIYASDGVHNPDSARGLVVFRANIGKFGNRSVDHLNPQTQE
ncbi:MAG: hypothetical protein M3285_12915 [Actinomycetota bacterium]|nr:hypothetical protein [Actinomycetota bacterium]